MSSQSILTIVGEALPLFSDDFRQEINEKLSNDVHFIVRATPRNKDEVKGWLEEFARLACVCYVVEKEHRNACRKAYRVEYNYYNMTPYIDRNKSMTSTSEQLIVHPPEPQVFGHLWLHLQERTIVNLH